MFRFRRVEKAKRQDPCTGTCFGQEDIIPAISYMGKSIIYALRILPYIGQDEPGDWILNSVTGVVQAAEESLKNRRRMEEGYLNDRKL